MWVREASKATGGVRHRCRAVADDDEEEEEAAPPVPVAVVVVAIASLGSTPMAYMA